MEANKDNRSSCRCGPTPCTRPLQAKRSWWRSIRPRRTSRRSCRTFAADGDVKVRQVHDHAVYAAMLETLDINVGRIVAKLEELGLADNTIIIFTSDNGGLATSEGWPTSNLPLRVGKGWLYEGGLARARGSSAGRGSPRRAAPATIRSSANDFYPTLLEMAGLEPRPEQHVDGVSFVPLLKQTGKLKERRSSGTTRTTATRAARPAAPCASATTRSSSSSKATRELYDVAKDSGEPKDLAKECPSASCRCW